MGGIVIVKKRYKQKKKRCTRVSSYPLPRSIPVRLPNDTVALAPCLFRNGGGRKHAVSRSAETLAETQECLTLLLGRADIE